MFVSVEILVDCANQLLRVPEIAVRPGKRLWVVRDGRIEILNRVRLVERITRSAPDLAAAEPETTKHWLVDPAGGLAEGDSVVVSPLAAVWDGMEVEEATGT
jgi:hypothetical protein